MRPGVRDALMKADSRNVAGEARTPNVGGVLPTTFIGSLDTVVRQVERCRKEVGVGVIDLMSHNPGDDPDGLMEKLELFGNKVLPGIREV